MHTSKPPLVSAIVPSFNKARYLSQSIGSILRQDYPALEVIIVNDGSPDNTSEVAKNLIALAKPEHPTTKFRILEKQNGGISDARNFGIAEANGDLIFTLDGDDIVKQGFFSQAVKRIVEHGDDLVCSNVELFGKQSGEWIPNEYDELRIRYDNSIPSMVLYRKDLWSRAGGYDVCFPFVEDWNFFLSCSRYFPRVHRLAEKFFLYRTSETGLAHIFDNRIRECLAMLVTAQDDLYPVSEVLLAHEITRSFPEQFIDRFQKQRSLHPDKWLLALWLALVAEAQGELDKSLSLYQNAYALSKQQCWQAAIRMASILTKLSRTEEAEGFVTRARLLRPELDSVLGISVSSANA